MSPLPRSLIWARYHAQKGNPTRARPSSRKLSGPSTHKPPHPASHPHHGVASNAGDRCELTAARRQPQPAPEPCKNCGSLDCDCDELRDRRRELRDLGYDLRIEERDAKQRVREIRA